MSALSRVVGICFLAEKRGSKVQGGDQQLGLKGSNREAEGPNNRLKNHMCRSICKSL